MSDTNDKVENGRVLSEIGAIEYINSLEKVYVMYSTAIGPNYPLIDPNGIAWVFSKPEYAEKLKQKNGTLNASYREMSIPEFKAFAIEWYAYGTCQFKLNPEIDDVTAIIQRDNYVPKADAKRFDYYGSALNQYILRYRQARVCKDNKDALALAHTMWSVICHQLYKSIFIVPFYYEDNLKEEENSVIHYTADAVKTINKLENERVVGNENVEFDNAKLHANIKLLIGSEGYEFTTPETTKSENKMSLRTIKNNVGSFLCAFTNLYDVRRVFGEKVSLSLMTYEEIISHTSDMVSDGSAIDGLVINAGGNTLILSLEDIEFAKKESKEDPKFYSVK